MSTESIRADASPAPFIPAPFIPAAKPVIGEEEIAAAVRVLRSGMVVQGPEVAAFEQEFSEFVGGRHCVAVNSGTSALLLSLVAAGIGAGDEVIVPSFTFAATGNSVALTGATPVFADIDPETFNLSPAAVEAAITPRTKAIMPVHLYGQAADMTRLVEIAQRAGIAVIEDAAQAHAATWNGTPVGAFGLAAAFSFYPTKNMHALEGGMVVTPDAEFARTIRLLRNQGMERRYANELVGYNLRLTDVAAAIGREQLKKLPAWTEQRRANAAKLDAGLGAFSLVRTPVVAEGATHVYHQYTVRVPGPRRDALQQHLTAQGIGSAVYYPTPTHRLPPFAERVALAEPVDGGLVLPETDRAAAEVLSLPVHPALDDADLDRVVRAVGSFDLGD
jgi:dTDP-4-amino-4,6-dideoxygalactose transaminase